MHFSGVLLFMLGSIFKSTKNKDLSWYVGHTVIVLYTTAILRKLLEGFYTVAYKRQIHI